MEVSRLLNPIYMPESRAAMSSIYSAPSPTPGPPSPLEPNPYNSKGDGFLVSAIYSGITSKNLAKAILPSESGLQGAIDKQFFLKQTGINMGVGAVVYGGMSLLKQTIGMASGKQSLAGAGANLTTDIVRGGAAGLGATAGAGLTAMALKALGSTGTFGIVASTIGGMVGASFGSSVVELTGIREKLLDAFGAKETIPAG